MKKHSSFYFTSFFMLVALLNGCTTKPKTETPAPPTPTPMASMVYREGKLDIQDLRRNKNHRINVEAYIIPNQKMRLEATAAMGVRVATILVSEDDIQAQLYREKKYLHGKFPAVWQRENPTLKAMSIPVSPSLLQAIIMEEAKLSNSWECVEKANASRECKNLNPSKDLPDRIVWMPLKNDVRTVTATSKTFRLTWELKKAETANQKPNTFTMQLNDSYEKVDITPR